MFKNKYEVVGDKVHIAIKKKSGEILTCYIDSGEMSKVPDYNYLQAYKNILMLGITGSTKKVSLIVVITGVKNTNRRHKDGNFLNCCKDNIHVPERRTELIGVRFGMLLVTATCGSERSHHGHTLVEVKCDCGNTLKITANTLVQGNSKSCGCIHRLTGDSNRFWKGIGPISGKYIGHVKHNANLRNLVYEVTDEYIYSLYLSQNKLCALSGCNINFFQDAVGARKQTASLDRIDSNNGYVEGNVHWVHKELNFMKSDHPLDYFISLCTQVADYQRSLNNSQVN